MIRSQSVNIWDLGLDFKKDISINILTQKTVNKKNKQQTF